MEAQTLREKLVRWIRKLRVRRCESPFVILFRERSGSTYLCSLLDSHKQISCRHEDFHGQYIGEVDDVPSRERVSNWKRRIKKFDESFVENVSAEDAVTHLYDTYSFQERACGFKLKFPHQFLLYPEVIREFAWVENLRVIILSRQNLLKQAVSRQNFVRIYSESGRSNLFPDRNARPEPLGRFELNIEDAMHYVKVAQTLQAKFEQESNQIVSKFGLDSIHVKYENLLAKRDETLKSVFEFLNVDPSLKIDAEDVQKATPDRLPDAITNYAELVKRVEGTKIAFMLDQ
ncbi:MAG: Stf0 family sulfotransferase [Mariniblastus sp.]